MRDGHAMRELFVKRSVATAAGLLVAVVCSAAEELAGADLLSLFPDSRAPAFYEKKSELSVQTRLKHWARNSKWHPELDERTVFHALLQHRSVEEHAHDVGVAQRRLPGQR
jgi:hypothetical protein